MKKTVLIITYLAVNSVAASENPHTAITISNSSSASEPISIQELQEELRKAKESLTASRAAESDARLEKSEYQALLASSLFVACYAAMHNIMQHFAH